MNCCRVAPSPGWNALFWQAAAFDQRLVVPRIRGMSVVNLPRRLGPKAPRHIARRVKYLRAVPAPVVALPINSKARAFNLYLAASAVDGTDIPAGIAFYEQALKADPNLSIAVTNLGNCHFRQGAKDVARCCYERALELNPEQPEALYNLGYLALQAGDLEQAIVLLEESVSFDPEFAEAWYNLGEAYEKQLGTHKSPRVYRCFQQFVKFAPADDEFIESARSRLG
jgi:tetratricopeptide (TPR) repeat protein